MHTLDKQIHHHTTHYTALIEIKVNPTIITRVINFKQRLKVFNLKLLLPLLAS